MVANNYRTPGCINIFLLYSLTSAQWSKITELGYRCATTVSFKVAYVV